jgi:hypothetical protein
MSVAHIILGIILVLMAVTLVVMVVLDMTKATNLGFFGITGNTGFQPGVTGGDAATGLTTGGLLALISAGVYLLLGAISIIVYFMTRNKPKMS